MYICEIYCIETGTELRAKRFRSVERAMDWAIGLMEDGMDYRIYPV